jgi:hypothetical protein
MSNLQAENYTQRYPVTDTCTDDPAYTNDGRCSKCYPTHRAETGPLGNLEHATRLAQAAATKWSSDEERAQVMREAEQNMARLAAYMGARYDDWRYGERGTGMAWNEPESCEAGGWG